MKRPLSPRRELVNALELGSMVVVLLITLSCGNNSQRQAGGQSIETKPLAEAENLAAATHGSVAIASSSAGGSFEPKNLNDGTAEAWGSAEVNADTWAAIVLPAPQAIHEYRIKLFSPNQPPRAHLRDIRVVVADSPQSEGPSWRVVRSRLPGSRTFSEKITIPPGAEGETIRIEVDTSDSNYGPHKIWGIACFSATRGDVRNYLTPGAGFGIYVRELQMK